MLKSVSIFILLLLAAGVATSLYLPQHNITPVPTIPYIINQASLEKPISENVLLPSQLTSSDNDDKVQYALQLGIFGTLATAKNFATQQEIQLKNKNIELPLLPSIIKIKANHRSWIILSLGPFEKQQELEHYQTLLLKQGINSQVMLWPATEIAKKKS